MRPLTSALLNIEDVDENMTLSLKGCFSTSLCRRFTTLVEFSGLGWRAGMKSLRQKYPARAHAEPVVNVGPPSCEAGTVKK